MIEAVESNFSANLASVDLCGSFHESLRSFQPNRNRRFIVLSGTLAKSAQGITHGFRNAFVEVFCGWKHVCGPNTQPLLEQSTPPPTTTTLWNKRNMVRFTSLHLVKVIACPLSPVNRHEIQFVNNAAFFHLATR